MSGDYVDRLIEAIGPPESVSMFSPGPLERALGRVLPSDFVKLMEAYGSVVSDDEDQSLRISVLGVEKMDSIEFVDSRNYSISYVADRVDELRFEGGEGKVVRSSYVLSRNPFNVFVIGEINENALALLFDETTDEWTIVIPRGAYLWQFEGGVCEFLLGLASGEVIPFYIEDFYSGVSFSRG